MSQKKGFIRSLNKQYHRKRQEQRYFDSIRRGAYALPPQSIKLAVINNIPGPRPRVFVETGTYHGETVEAVKRLYAKVVSIEVDDTLYRKACTRFAADGNVQIVHGDCASKLPEILAGLKEPAVFWLDGHYSGGETGMGEIEDPILISLDQIAAHPVKGHVIFIDDARTFDGRPGHPDISDVLGTIKKIDKRYVIRIQSDIVVASFAPHPAQ